MDWKEPDLDKMMAEAKKLREQAPTKIYGLVFRSGLKEHLLNSSIKADIKITGEVTMWHSTPVFFDDYQEDDLRVFENQELLYAYLNRQSKPNEWLLAKIKASTNWDDDRLNLLRPLKPNIPDYTNPLFGVRLYGYR